MNKLETAIGKVQGLPCWQGVPDCSLMEGGITNLNLLVTDGADRYFARVADDIPEHMIMRWNEVAVSRAAHDAGIAPRVHYDAPGVLVLEYVDSRPLEEGDLHDPATLSRVVDLTRAVHEKAAARLRGAALAFWAFHVANVYAGFLQERGSRHTPRLAGLLKQANRLEEAVGPVDLVLGHNDMLPANFLDDGKRLWLVDWEYAGFNSPLFDLGGIATNADLSEDLERSMLETYFGEPASGALWHRYTAMKCGSLLRETLWSMVSELTSEIDFDYGAYTLKNLERFEAAYAAFEALRDPA